MLMVGNMVAGEQGSIETGSMVAGRRGIREVSESYILIHGTYKCQGASPVFLLEVLELPDIRVFNLFQAKYGILCNIRVQFHSFL